MTLLEKILAAHSKYDVVQPGEIVDIEIDSRVADPDKTLFTFDCNPTGSDQKYAAYHSSG